MSYLDFMSCVSLMSYVDYISYITQIFYELLKITVNHLKSFESLWI